MPESSLSDDLLLSNVPVREGYKVLGGVVIYQKLGQGGMGAVYRGKHLRLNADVAVKVMAPPIGLPPEQAESYVRRFIREAQTAVSASHQNLIRVYDVDTDSGVHFIIMDFVDGESAGDRLKRKGRLTDEEAVEICLGAAEGLGEAHRRGIVHRDVKPDNIMIDKEGRVRVTDLGLAKAYSAEAEAGEPSMLTQTQTGMGTPYYMSPEQFRAARDVGPAADVWSLGVTLYHLLTGRVPWSDTSVFTLAAKIQNDPLPDPKRMCAGLSGGVCQIIEKAVRKDPAQRYADCSEMAKALRQHLDSTRTATGGALADIEAGATKFALASMTPPPSRTLTLIGRTLLRPSDSERLAAQPRADTAVTAPAGAPALGRGGLPAWVIPTSIVGGLALLGVILWVALGAGRPGGESVAGRQPVQSDPIEAEAQRFLGRATAIADDGRLGEAAKLIEEAGTKYDATAAGPKIARFAETLQSKIAVRKRQEEEERERARQEAARRLADAVARADRAEKGGDLDGAVRELRPFLAGRDDPDLRKRIERIERALGARSLIEEGAAHEEAGELERAKVAYEKAIPDVVGEDASKAQERLTEVEKRIRTQEVIADLRRKVDGDEWLAAWRTIEAARVEGISDAQLGNVARPVAQALMALRETLKGPLEIELVLVPGGSFTMGSNSGAGHEKPLHRVTVSSFYVGRYEVTRGQFDAFRRKERAPAKSGVSLEPVASVSWHEAVEFCEYLTILDRSGAKYRLPTEAEWEFAARGEAGREYPWGDGPPEADRANLRGKADGYERAAPVRSFKRDVVRPGVYDMAGNVAEWCLDWIGRYPSEAQTDPTGPPTGTMKVVRGGSFAHGPEGTRGAARSARDPGKPAYPLGFRVARELTEEERIIERQAAGE